LASISLAIVDWEVFSGQGAPWSLAKVGAEVIFVASQY